MTFSKYPTGRCSCLVCSDGRCGVETDQREALTRAFICTACQKGEHRVRYEESGRQDRSWVR